MGECRAFLIRRGDQRFGVEPRDPDGADALVLASRASGGGDAATTAETPASRSRSRARTTPPQVIARRLVLAGSPGSYRGSNQSRFRVSSTES